ncbi:MAG TPA: GGDEF domain-containing protein [Burkholderiaceae bacterium]|nr:GGDEF domain-containing protein [Burkholderiaceae bacterium]
MPFAYAASLLLLQFAVLALSADIARPAAYIVMVVAPLAASFVVARRGLEETSAARTGWHALALSLAIWSLGALGNLWHEWVLGRANEMYREAMLAFNLAAVPIAFLISSGWHLAERRSVRAIDALLALALGYGFFLFTWAMLTARGSPDEAGVNALVWLLDAQNLFLATGALVRWHASDDASERELFRAVSTYQVVYTALILVNNHLIAGDPDFGPQASTIITAAFALVGAMAASRRRGGAATRSRAGLVRVVHSASPIVLAGALLIVSLFMIRVDYAIGTTGVLIAVIGYGLRTTLTQVRHIELGDDLRRERFELQAIAWTDALTGVRNRRFIDHALARAARRARHAGRPLSVLMIDIDHFKGLNDFYGHPAGDACLREVATALQHALARPDDVLARYGGEEFIALLHDVEAPGALVVAERLRAAIEALRIHHNGSPFGVVTVSIGAASTASHDADAADLIEAADAALYEAKRSGRNRVEVQSTVPA